MSADRFYIFQHVRQVVFHYCLSSSGFMVCASKAIFPDWALVIMVSFFAYLLFINGHVAAKIFCFLLWVPVFFVTSHWSCLLLVSFFSPHFPAAISFR